MPDLGNARTQISSNTLTHANNTNEQDTLIFTNLRNFVQISADMNAFVQTTTVRVFEKVDGINYRQKTAKVFPTDYETGTKAITIILDGGGKDMKFTLESSVAEGATRNIPVTIRETTRP